MGSTLGSLVSQMPVSLGILSFSRNPLRHSKTPTMTCEQSYDKEMKVGEVLIHPLCSIPLIINNHSTVVQSQISCKIDVSDFLGDCITPPNLNPDDPKLKNFRFYLCKYKCLLSCASGLQVLNEAQIQECLNQLF